MVELWINDKYVDLEEKQKIALYYQLSKLGDLENRKSNVTSNITAPYTQNNCITFDYLNIPESASELPYVKMSAKMKVDGMEVIRSGFAIIDDISDKGFELNVYWGNYDLFSILKERKLSDLDLVAYDDIQRVTYATALTGIVYPLIDWHKDSPNSAMLETGSIITSAFIYPAFYLATLFDEIITQSGFTYEIIFDKLADFSNKIIPLQTRKSDANLDLNCNVHYDLDESITEYVLNGTTILLPFTKKVVDKFTLYNNTTYAYCYEAPADGLFSFQLKLKGHLIKLSGMNYYSVYFNIKTNKGDYVTEEVNSISPVYNPGDPVPFEFTLNFSDIQLNKDDYVWVEYYSASTLYKFYIDNGNNFFKCTKSELKFTSPNIDYPVSANLPQMTQAELVKYVMQRYGLFCSITDNHATFFSIDTVIDNKGNAVSLDDKIVSDKRMFENKKPSIDGFGQKNIWEYAKDEEINSGYVECNNTNLEKEQKIYTAPFAECSDSIRLGGVKMANIKRLEQKGTPLASWWKYDVKPKILSSYLLTKNFTWYVSGGGSSAITSIIVGVFDDYVNVDSCDMQKTLDENYTELANILTNPSEIKVFVNWNIQDFININPMYPYYLWNSFYILNSVDGFVEGELTKLDLIRI